jgi:phage baseplate assembly protein V
MSGGTRGRYDRIGSDADPFTLQDIHRRLHQTVRFGTIEKIDHNKAQARVKIGPLMSAWIPWHSRHAGQDADWAPPSAGEQVTLLCPSGNLAQAVFMHGLYQDKFPQPSKNKDERKHNLKDGTSITHNVKDKTRVTSMPKEGAHTISVDKQKNVVDTAGTRIENDKATVHVHPDGKVRVINNSGSNILTSSGSILINC